MEEQLQEIAAQRQAAGGAAGPAGGAAAPGSKAAGGSRAQRDAELLGAAAHAGCCLGVLSWHDLQ